MAEEGTQILKGICPKCEKTYCRWAPKNPIHQACQDCGSQLEINEIGNEAANLHT